jgi:hypothetical protein
MLQLWRHWTLRGQLSQAEVIMVTLAVINPKVQFNLRSRPFLYTNKCNLLYEKKKGNLLFIHIILITRAIQIIH